MSICKVFRLRDKVLVATIVVFALGAVLLPTFFPAALIYLAVTSPENRVGAIASVAVGEPIALAAACFILYRDYQLYKMGETLDRINN